jgi:hypothetical protein
MTLLHTETPETPPDTPVEHDANEFDFKRSEVILPARTAVYAYIDPETGDLRIHASDAANQRDDEIRINAEDVAEFVDQLAQLVKSTHGRRAHE